MSPPCDDQDPAGISGPGGSSPSASKRMDLKSPKLDSKSADTPLTKTNITTPTTTITTATTTTTTTTANTGPRPVAKVIARSKRRGLFGAVTLLPEVDDALLYSNQMKGVIIFIIAFASMIGPMGTSIVLPALSVIVVDFQTSGILVNVAFGVYLLAMGVFPLWWSRSSEFFGRRSIYLVSFGFYVVTSVGCALSTNIGMFIAFRVLAGGSSASVQALGAGTISDIYISTERGRAAGWYYLGPLAGPLISPVIGGLLTQHLGWRSTQWFCTILSGVIFLMIFFFLPETLKRTESIEPATTGPTEPETTKSTETEPERSQEKMIKTETNNNNKNKNNNDDVNLLTQTYTHGSLIHLTQSCLSGDIYLGDVEEPDNDIEIQSQHSQFSQYEDKTINIPLPPQGANTEPKSPTSSSSSQLFQDLSIWGKLHLLFISPLHTLLILQYPPVLLSILCSTYCFFVLYLMNIRLETTYSNAPYNFNSTLVGLVYLPNSVSYILASLLNGSWSDKNIKRSIAKHGKLIPEERIAMNVYLGSVIYPASLIFFGWTADKKLFWLVPLIGSFCFGGASMVLFGTFLTYLVDALPGRGSSGVALNNLCRMTGAFIASFIADPLAEAMGSGWMFTMWGLMAYLLIGLLVLIKVKGDYWRANFDLDSLL